MTYREKYAHCNTWQDKCVIINLFHAFKNLEERKWTLRMTATYFSLSLGSISEAILLANNFEIIKDVPQRKDALALLRIGK